MKFVAIAVSIVLIPRAVLSQEAPSCSAHDGAGCKDEGDDMSKGDQFAWYQKNVGFRRIRTIDEKEETNDGAKDHFGGDPLHNVKVRLMEIRSARAQQKLADHDQPPDDADMDWNEFDIMQTSGEADGDGTINDIRAGLLALAEMTPEEVRDTCPTKHFFAGIDEDQTTGEVHAICDSCATNCASCFGSLMTQCSQCEEPFAMLMVRDNPVPRFACVEKCPECYHMEDGVCAFERDCELTSDVVQVPMAGNFLNTEEQASLPELKATSESTGQMTTNSSLSATCDDKREAIEDEVDAWMTECWDVALSGPKQACATKDNLKGKVGDFKRMADNVKTATGSSMQNFLNSIRNLPIVGSVAGKLKTAAAHINPKAVTASTKSQQILNKLSQLDAPCNRMKQADTLLKQKIDQARVALNRFSSSCGCDCLDTNIQPALDTSASYRQQCVSALNVSLNINPLNINYPTMPNWLNDILEFIGDMVAELDWVLNYKHKYKWCLKVKVGPIKKKKCWSWTYTVKKILQQFSKFISLIRGLVENAIWGIINAMLRALGLPSFDAIISRIMNQIPLTVSWPNVNCCSFSYPSWSAIAITWPIDWADFGCAAESCLR